MSDVWYKGRYHRVGRTYFTVNRLDQWQDDAMGEEKHPVGQQSCPVCRGHGSVCGCRCVICGGAGVVLYE